LSFLRCLVIAAAVGAISAGSASAGFRIDPDASSEQATPKNPPPPVPTEAAKLPPVPTAEAVDAALGRLIANNLPKMPLEPYRFDETKGRDCGEQRGSEPMVRALLVASYEVDENVTGAASDIEMIVSALKSRGVPENAISVLDGSKLKTDFDRAKLIDGFNKVLACVRAGDQVIFHFSGFSMQPIGWAPADKLRFINRDMIIAEFCKLEKPQCERWAKEEAVDAIFRERLERFPSAALAVSNVAATYGRRKEVTGLWDFELANFITQVRNRGADVFAFLDTSYAASYRFGDLQMIARHDRKWQARGSNWSPDLVERTTEGDRLVPLERDAGAFAAFYASGSEGEAYGIKSGDKNVGAFSLALSHTLLTEQTPDVTTLAQGIVRALASGLSEQDKKSGLLAGGSEFEASSSALAVLAPRKPLESNSDDIEIIEPAATRGGSALPLPEDGPVRIVARFKRPSDADLAMIREQVVPMARDGTFSTEIAAVERNESINVSVLTHQRQFVTRKISVAPPALPQSLVQGGRRFALLIGNANYLDQNFGRLSMPPLDVKAVKEVLTRDFGFVTSLPARAGKETSLVLLDAKGDQIYETLDALTEELGPEDQLLIYYAGHGLYEEATNTAYWVPIDARHGRQHSFVPATDITRALQRMKARNILVVSDSCYAGAMARSGEQGLPVAAADRVRALTKIARQTSRILLTSGGNEPVLDEGGKGHSIFARAFIDGLASMDFDAFTAQELYAVRILPVVSGKAKQEPKHSPLRESGHEGGDFVFVRMPQASAAQK
jgi:Caspase domain